jgi:hypothetical protein
MSNIAKILPYCVDLEDTLKKTELHTIFVMSESLAHRFEIEIKSGGKDVDLSGRTVMASFTNFREKTTIEMTGEVKDGKAVVTLEKPCYTLRGQFVLIVMVKDGDADVAVFLGEGHMRTSRAEKIVIDDYVIYDVDTLLAEINAMKAATTNANNAAASARREAEKISGMTVSATSSDTAGATISDVNGVKHIDFKLPKGEPGDTGADGISPSVSVQSITGGHRVSITDNAGTKTFDVMNGKDGTGGGGTGEAGEDGGYYTPSVDSAGNLTWTASKAGMPSVSGANIKGPTGATGPAGKDGANGTTPVRGTDYWTSADIAEIKGYVDDAILNGAW